MPFSEHTGDTVTPLAGLTIFDFLLGVISQMLLVLGTPYAALHAAATCRILPLGRTKYNSAHNCPALAPVLSGCRAGTVEGVQYCHSTLNSNGERGCWGPANRAEEDRCMDPHTLGTTSPLRRRADSCAAYWSQRLPLLPGSCSVGSAFAWRSFLGCFSTLPAEARYIVPRPEAGRLGLPASWQRLPKSHPATQASSVTAFHLSD